MGLDMYAYVGRKGQRKEFYEQAGLKYNAKTGGWDVPNDGVSEPVEIAYWRKHPNLHGWMEQLWERKGYPGVDIKNYAPDEDPDFNQIELELTWEDIDQLEQDIRNKKLPSTTGFFFGNPSDDYYKEHDLKFCIDAKAELFLGFKVFYNSSW